MSSGNLLLAVKELSKPKKIFGENGLPVYERLSSGKYADIGDYCLGVLLVRVGITYNKRGDHHVVFSVTSIDDTAIVGWSKTLDRNEAVALAEKVAENVLWDMREVPPLEEINAALIKYGIYATIQ